MHTLASIVLRVKIYQASLSGSLISSGTHFCFENELSQNLILGNYQDKCGWPSLVSIKIALFERKVRKDPEISFPKSQVYCIYELIEAQGRQSREINITRIKGMFNYSTLICFCFLSLDCVLDAQKKEPQITKS